MNFQSLHVLDPFCNYLIWTSVVLSQVDLEDLAALGDTIARVAFYLTSPHRKRLLLRLRLITVPELALLDRTMLRRRGAHSHSDARRHRTNFTCQVFACAQSAGEQPECMYMYLRKQGMHTANGSSQSKFSVPQSTVGRILRGAQLTVSMSGRCFDTSSASPSLRSVLLPGRLSRSR